MANPSRTEDFAASPHAETAHGHEPGRPSGEPKSCVVALTAAKDGAGRTTLAAHLAVAALQLGLNVGVIDLDCADRALTRWLNRRARINDANADLVMPASLQGEPRDPEGERARWPAAIEAMRRTCALVVVDMPAGGGLLARDAIARADRVLTLVPDNDADVDRLFDVDIKGKDSGRPSSYARTIWDERLDRARGGRSVLDWRLMRTRGLGDEGGQSQDRFADALRRLGAHDAPAMRELAVWRRGFAQGATALDLPASDPERRAPAEMLRDLLIALRAPGLEGARLAL
ncbi:MAG: division plane positioning ATPase MipZ [Maricaulaceae bacterium]|jgi:chromosome partitioning protein